MTTAPPPSSPASHTTQGAASQIEYDTPDEATAAATEPPPPLPKASSSSFGFKRGFLNTNSSSTSSSTVRSATTTTASKGSITADETEPAKAPTSSQPSTEDQQDDECVLCCYPLPLNRTESRYKECCGELICMGCIMAEERVLILGENIEKPIPGSPEEDREFLTMLLSEHICVCPFCRAEAPTTAEELLKRLRKRIDKDKDPKAMNMLSGYYSNGKHGLSRNLQKAEELYKGSYALGSPYAARNLFLYYSNHIINAALASKYLEEGARRGDAYCMTLMAHRAAQSGNDKEATRLLIAAVRSGDDTSIKQLMACSLIPGSVVSKDDLAAILRAHKAAHDMRKSEPREYARRHKIFEDKMVSTGKLRQI